MTDKKSAEEKAVEAVMALPEETRNALVATMEAKAIAEFSTKERALYDDICKYLDNAYAQDPRTTCIALAHKTPIFLRAMEGAGRNHQKTSTFDA